MSADAHSLRCPHCGAAADPESSRCRYCQARLATVSCPSCFARIFDGAAFCSACGARRARTEAEPEEAPCPSCQSGLTAVQVGSTAMLECGTCEGVWIDAAVFEALCASREAGAAVLHQLGARPARKRDTRVGYRRCPRCGQMMNRVNFGRMSGAIVDVCRGHGTFLDAGELHAIMTFIQGGGLDRARQRQMEDLREQEQRLKDAERRAAHDRSTDLHTTSTSTRMSFGNAGEWSAEVLAALLDAMGNKP
jgi:Zn-finger nucleic acid-binding protein